MNKHLHFTKNCIGTDYFVGDIHGCVDMFLDELGKTSFHPTTDRVFSIGDLVDRGPDSERSLYLLNQPWFFAVRGNHEDMAIKYSLGNFNSDLYYMNGGRWMICLEEKDKLIFADAFSQLPFVITVDTDVGLVAVLHAEPGDDLNETVSMLSDGDENHRRHAEHLLFWDRERIGRGRDAKDVLGADFVVVGHTPVKKITRIDNVLYIDTGAVFGVARGYGTMVIDTIQNILERAK